MVWSVGTCPEEIPVPPIMEIELTLIPFAFVVLKVTSTMLLTAFRVLIGTLIPKLSYFKSPFLSLIKNYAKLK